MKLMLFGSRANGTNRRDSDVDVILLTESHEEKQAEVLIDWLRPHALEHGGKLDMFTLGDTLGSVYCYDKPGFGKPGVDEWGDYGWDRRFSDNDAYDILKHDMKPTSLAEVITMLNEAEGV